MCGARAFRHVFLFRRAIIIAKKKAEGLLLVKAFIMVGHTFYYKKLFNFISCVYLFSFLLMHRFVSNLVC